MLTFANYKSIKTELGMKIFRYNTVFQSENGPGEIIGLVYMMNPGDARPESNEIFDKLQSSEYETVEPIISIPDKTMNKAIKFIKEAYQDNGIELPPKYTFQVENLFNLREKKSAMAQQLEKELKGLDDIMYKTREFKDTYNFVWLAWGKNDVQSDRQKQIINKYSNAIIVNKINHREKTLYVQYPVHPLYMNMQYFLEAAKGKIK